MHGRLPACFAYHYLVAALVVPQLTESIALLVDRLPEALARLCENEAVTKYLPLVSEKLEAVDWDILAAQVQNFVKTNAGGIVGGLAAVPLASTAYQLIRNDASKRRHAPKKRINKPGPRIIFAPAYRPLQNCDAGACAPGP